MWNLPPPPGFQGLHPDQPITVYQRHLPHWRQDGATYFVTFRLADSLPQSKLDELAALKEALVIPDILVSWLAEFYQHAHGWSQLCSHGRQFTRPRQRNGLGHSSMGSGLAIARGGNASWRMRRRLLNSRAR
jgi:hypothetical protein